MEEQQKAPEPQSNAPAPAPKKPSRWQAMLQAIGNAIGESKFGG